jgi:hypothetical protein
MAKGTHVLMYQGAIDGIGLTLSEAWNNMIPRYPKSQISQKIPPMDLTVKTKKNLQKYLERSMKETAKFF